MRRFAVYGLAAVGLLFLAAIAGLFSGARAIAQTVIKAVLVKSIDEPGRSPYTSTVGFFGTPGPSSACRPSTFLDCDLLFAVVPNGKRLVLQHVSARATLAGTDMMLPLEINYHSPLPLPTGSDVSIGHVGPLTIEPASGGQSRIYSFDSPFTGYVEPVSQPIVAIHLRPASSGFTGLPNIVVTLTGYLVDLTQ